MKEDGKLLTDSKETPLANLNLVMDRPPGQKLAGPKEADPVSVNQVTGKGTQDSHRHTQGPLMAMLDLNMESRDPPGKEDRELLTDRQETPLDIPRPLMDKPPGQNLVGLGEQNPVSVSPVTVKGTQESHRHRQGPLMAMLGLNMESRDPPGKEDRELLTDRQETQLDIPSPLMDKPPGQNPVGLGEENPVSVSPVTLKGTQESHRHRQGPLMATLDSNRGSQDPPMKEDGKLLTDSKETPLANLNLVMDRPPGQNLAGPKEADPVSVNRVTGKGTQDSHRHTQSPLMARLDLSMKSQDPPGKEDRVLLKDSKETPLDMHCLVMDRPPGQNPVGQEEQDPGAVSPVTGEGLQESHRHRQGLLMAMLDLNMESRDPPGKEDQKLLTDSKETPLDKLILVLDRPPGQNLAGPKEADPVSVNRVTGKAGSQHGESGSTQEGRQGTTHRQAGDTTRHTQSGHGQATRSESSRTGRRESSVSESSDSERHSGVPQTQAGSPHGHPGFQQGESRSTLKGRQGTTHRQVEDSTRHAQSGHGQATRTESSRARRTGSSISESSDTETHSGVPQTQAGSPHGHPGFQQGESGSTHEGRQETTHGQQVNTTRHALSGHAQATRTESSRTGRTGSRSSESRDRGRPSGVPQTHAASPHGHAGSQLSESTSTHEGRLGTTHPQTGDTTGPAQSGHGQATSAESRWTGRKGSSVSESSDTERHSGVSQGHSVSSHRHFGSIPQNTVSNTTRRHGSSTEESGDSSKRSIIEQGKTSIHKQPSSRRSGIQASSHRHVGDKSTFSGSAQGHTTSSRGPLGIGTTEQGGSSHTQSHDTHRHTSDSISMHSHSSHHQSRVSHSQSQLSGRQRHGSGQGWKHGSYGSAEYDYGQSGYGPSGGSRTSSHNSSPLRSTERAANNQVSTHGQLISGYDHTESKATEITERQGSSHGQSADSHNQSASSVTRRQGSSHRHSVVSHEPSSDTHVQSGRWQSSNHSIFSHGQSISAHCHSKSGSTLRQGSHSGNKGNSKDWGKQIHESSGSTHRQSEFNNISMHESSQEHLGDTSSHEQIRSSTSLVRQGSSNRQSVDIQGQSGFSTNERQVYSHDQSSDSYEQSSDSRSRRQGFISSHSLNRQDPTGSEKYGYRHSSSSKTIRSGEKQKQGPTSSLLGSISIYSQDVDNMHTRNSEARGCHKRGRTESGSFYLEGNTPLYEYVQEQRYYYFE
ncbi:uncharacterized protein LOC144617026 [Panthera onca]